MPALYISEITDPKLLALPKFGVGDMVRIVKITLTHNDAPDTKAAFLAALGQVLPINEIELWETEKPDNPYYVTYEFEVGHLTIQPFEPHTEHHYETIYLSADEIELVEKKST